MKVILHTMDVAAEPGTVYRALATGDGLRGWWSTKVTADEEVGGRAHFVFIADFNPVMEITELEPDRGVAWRCVGGHEPWTDNRFRFEIRERQGGSTLLFRQDYAQELSDEEYGRYNFNWGYYLHSLKRLCEANEGAPFAPPEAAS